MITLKNKIMKKLTLTITALLIVLSSFGKSIIHVHEYIYTYAETSKGVHLKNAAVESKKGFRLIGITYDSKAKTVKYSYTNSKEAEVVNVLQAKYEIKVY